MANGWTPLFLSRRTADNEQPSDLAGLLDNLDWNNWFEMLPIISDAAREIDWVLGDIVNWIIENQIKPNKITSFSVNKQWFSWSQVEKLGGISRMFMPAYETCGVALVELLDMISKSEKLMKKVEENQSFGYE